MRVPTAAAALAGGLILCSAGALMTFPASANAAGAPYSASVSRANCNSNGTSDYLTATVTVNDVTLNGKSARFQAEPGINAAGDTDPWTGTFTIAAGRPQAVALHRIYSPETVYSGNQTGVGTVVYVDSKLYGPVQVTIAACKTGDTTAPTVATQSLPVFTLASTTSFSWTATDAGTGVANYDIRYRRASFNGAMGALTYPSAWQRRTIASVSLPAVKGSTICFSVRGRDREGNTSTWSAERCTAVPLDDRSLSASPGWSRTTSSVYYGATATTIARSGAVLTRTGVQTRRVALVATSCRGCGTVGVYWNGRLIKQVSLAGTATTQRRIISITDFGTARSGTLTIRTLNTGHVYIDGLGLRRI